MISSMRFHCVALALGAIAVLAQSSQQQPGVKLRSTTRLVQVDVAVRDKDGAPVGNLSKDDFALKENGVPQQISVFVAESAQNALFRLPELPPGAVSNRAGSSRGATVLLLDSLNTPALYRAKAKPRIAQFVRSVLALDRIAMYSLGDSLTVAVDFTTDTATLLNVLERYATDRNVNKDVVDAEIRAMNRGDPASVDTVFLGRTDSWNPGAVLQAWALTDEYQAATIDRVRATCAALRAIANRVRGVPGRKNLVWVTTGFPLHQGSGTRQQSFTTEFNRALRELNDAGVSVYPVDARGIQALRGTLVDTSETAMMHQVANQTGGRMFRGVELDEAGREVVADVRASYTLGYYPINHEFDGKFRRIDVRVNRRGLALRHRAGYYAAPEPDIGTDAGKTAVADAVWSPLDSSGLGLDAWIERKAGASAAIVVRVHGGSLPLEPKGDRYACPMQFVLVQTTAAGKQIEGLQDSTELRLTNEQLARVLEQGFEYRKPVTVHPDAAAIRVVVRSLTTGALGSVKIPLAGPAQPGHNSR